MHGNSCRWWSLVILSLWIYCLGSPVLGQDDPYRLDVDFGYRWQPSFGGSEDLYRSQLNYGEGPKLFAADFFMSPPPGSNRFFDRLQVKMNSWGGEPYNTAQVRMSKAGSYELRFDYQNAAYFNAVPSFANPFFDQGVLESQHKFDISQRSLRLQLTFRPEERISPFIVWEHTDRAGPVRTTLATDANEFLLGSDLDTRSNDLRGGINLNLSRFSLLLEQGFRRYRDDSVFAASGTQEGNRSGSFLGQDITLSEYNGENNFKATIPFTNAIAVYRPLDSLLLRGKFSYSMASSDSNFSDELEGNLFSFPLRAFYGGGGELSTGNAKQPSLHGDFTASWQPRHWLRIVERVNVRRLHVSGSALTSATFLNVDPALSNEIIESVETSSPFNTFLSTDLTTQELQGLFFLTPEIIFRVGHRYENKKVGLSESFSWDRNVFISGFSYQRPARGRLAVDYELGRTDKPIFRTDPVDFQRLRIRGSISPVESLELSGSLTLFDHDNDVEEIDFTSRSRNYSLRFTYAPTAQLSVSGEYQRSNLDTDILVIVPQTFLSARSMYRELGNYGRLWISYLLPRDASLSLGYSVWGTSGNFPVNYHQPMIKGEVPLHRRLSAYLQWNYYGYNEKLDLFPQDYRTHLLTLGFRFSMDRE